MPRLHSLTLVAAATASTLALANPVPKTPAKDPSNGFYPTAVGTKWVYHDERSGVYTEEIVAAEVKDGARLLTIRRRSDRDDPKAKPWDRKETVTDKGVFTGHGGGTPDRKQTCLITLPPKPGDTWKSRWDPSWTCMVIGTEKVKVPAGEYEAVRVEAASGSGRGYTTYSNWYAPGVGMVQMTDNKGRAVLTLKSFTRGRE